MLPSNRSRRWRFLPGGWPPAWTAGGLLLTAALFRSSQNAGQTTFPLLARDRLGAGAGAVGALGTVSGAVMVVAATMLAARLSTRAAATAAALGATALTAALLVVGSAASMLQLGAGMVLLGVASGLTPPSLATAIGSAAGERRDKLLALYATVLSASLAGGPLLETAILSLAHQNVRLAFFAFAGLPLLAVGLGLSRKGRAEPQTAPRRAGQAVAMSLEMDDPAALASGAASSDEDDPPSPEKVRRPATAVLLGTRGGRIALSVQLLYSMPFATVTVFGALIARSEFGLDAGHSQLGFTTFFAASFASRVIVARRSPITAKMAVFAGCVALTVAGLILLVVGGPPVDFFLAMALLGMPHGAIFPLALALVASSSRRDQLAAANAGLFAAGGLVAAVAPAALGLLASASGYRAMTAAVLVPVAGFSVLLATQRGAPAAGIATPVERTERQDR